MTLTDRQASIEYILEKGLIARETTWEKARKIVRYLGFRLIFWDAAYSLVFTFFTVGVMVTVAAFTPQHWRYSVAVGFSPAVFLVIVLMTEVIERATSLYELRQTCHFTTGQITAVRVMFYSVFGVASSAAMSYVASDGFADFLTMLPLNLAVLFFCASIQVFFLGRKRYTGWLTVAGIVSWALLNVGLVSILNFAWETFLSSCSIAVTSVVCVVCVGLFLWQITSMLTETRRHAFA